MSRRKNDGKDCLTDLFSQFLKGAVSLALLTGAALLLLSLHASDASAQQCGCATCHTSTPHPGSVGCSGCHNSPPQTGTHLVHFNSAPTNSLIYGDLSINSTDDAYRFGCGNCHPLDVTQHNNGLVNIELYNENAPTWSLKAKNPSTAAYTPGPTITSYLSNTSAGGTASFSYSDGTCRNVYCHSGYSISSGPVGLPVGTDQYGNPTYDPYTVTYTRVYKTTPPWGTLGSFTTCRECHEFPLKTSFPSVEAGVGDSHQWVDNYGYGNLHAYDMGFNPVSCRTCHYATVTEANAWSRDGMDVTTYSPVVLASRQYHVNGSKDVYFDTVNPVVYQSAWSGGAIYSLSGATYDGALKSCSNVACHQQQTRVTWGSPFRWWNSTECNLCHGN